MNLMSPEPVFQPTGFWPQNVPKLGDILLMLYDHCCHHREHKSGSKQAIDQCGPLYLFLPVYFMNVHVKWVFLSPTDYILKLLSPFRPL